MHYLHSTGFGPNRAERRASNAQARSNRVTSKVTKYMDRPSKAEYVANGYLKIQKFFGLR